MRRFIGIALLVGLASSGGSPLHGARLPQQAQSQRDHVAWVEQALRRMETIKAGMTRAELVEVFKWEGGGFTRLRRTYVSRECPYFKVDVEFEAVGPAGRDLDGRVMVIEGRDDRIVKISRPYLQFSILD